MKRLEKGLFLALLLLAAVGFGKPLEGQAATSRDNYLIKVNKQRNVVTVYRKEKKKYVPCRAFVCSVGYATPLGTFPLKEKYRWHTLMGPSYGQYCSRITRGILFHSVWYYRTSKNTQSYVQYNRLGTTASHGCVRLTVAGSKWIYDNCPSGTKVIIYNSSKSGPLGKPRARKMSGSMGWDPTDPDPANPYFVKMKSFQINKKKVTLKIGRGKKKAKTVLRACKVKPKRAMIKDVRFVSSNSKVATVNRKGEVKAKKAGKCKIYLYSKDGSRLKKTCRIVVKNYKKKKKKPKKPKPVSTPEPVVTPLPTEFMLPTEVPVDSPAVSPTTEAK